MIRKKDRILVSERVGRISDMVGRRLSDIINEFQNQLDRYGPDCFVDSFSYDDEKYFGIYIRRLENDIEYAARMEQQKKYEEYDQRQYEALKKRFEQELKNKIKRYEKRFGPLD